MSDNPSSKQNISGIVARAKAIVVKPKDEWLVIDAEPATQAGILTGYALPLIAIGPICGLIGGQLIGYGGMGIHFRPDLLSAVIVAILDFAISVIMLFVGTYIVTLLAPKFGGKADWISALKLVVYSMTPAWLVAVFKLVPMLWIFQLLGLYAIYLFYLGATRVTKVPEDQAGGFTAVMIIAWILIGIVLGLIATSFASGPGIMM